MVEPTWLHGTAVGNEDALGLSKIKKTNLRITTKIFHFSTRTSKCLQLSISKPVTGQVLTCFFAKIGPIIIARLRM